MNNIFLSTIYTFSEIVVVENNLSLKCKIFIAVFSGWENNFHIMISQ